MKQRRKRATPDSMLVEPETIAESYHAVAEPRESSALEDLQEREPALDGWLEEQLLVIAGKMTRRDAPRNVIAGTYNDFMTTLLVAIESVRKAHDDSWDNDELSSDGDDEAGHADGDVAASTSRSTSQDES